jgi:hypothetical protein
MKLPAIDSEIAQEFIERLERQGKSDEYIGGVLEGMSFVLEFYAGMVQLYRRQKELIKEEHNVST